MQLHKFADKKGAPTLSADHLDENFARLRPLLQDGTEVGYSVTETPGGWSLSIFPPLPDGAGGPFVLGFSGGRLVWLPTEECD
jgi:hypothetical protein